MKELQFEILELIDSKREGSFWDFKAEPHENNASLLHDILCLSNSLYKGNRYLILGVKDPNEGCEIIGLKTDQANRKTQNQIIDFIRNKKFAGQIRPEIELRTLIIKNKQVDVITIFDIPYKPFYLVESYRDRERVVQANFIYTRTNDTNTPINQSADIGKIEKMWRERFGLDIAPLERMKLLLRKPEEWFKDIGNKLYAYHNKHPEFRIEFSDLEEFWEPYSYFFLNPKSFLGNAVFKYHSTTLFELQYITCDEMRIEFSAPSPEAIFLSDSKAYYFYFELEELDGAFLEFLTDNLSRLKSRGSYFPFIIFRNKNEREEFNNYVIENEKSLNNLKPSFTAKNAKKIMDDTDRKTVVDPEMIDRILQMHENWVSA